MLERAGQISYFRFELVDGGGFGGWGAEVVWFSTLGRVVGVASGCWLWRHGVIVMGALGAHVCCCYTRLGSGESRFRVRSGACRNLFDANKLYEISKLQFSTFNRHHHSMVTT